MRGPIIVNFDAGTSTELTNVSQIGNLGFHGARLATNTTRADDAGTFSDGINTISWTDWDAGVQFVGHEIGTQYWANFGPSILGSATGGLDQTANPNAGAGLSPTNLTIAATGNNWTLLNIRLNADVTAVPEPSTYAIILGLGALGFVMYRRRQQ